MVLFVVVGMAAPASAAATGAITDFTITVTDDGTEPANLDGAKDNGLIAVGAAVTMSWSVSAQELNSGTLTQTLPEGWWARGASRTGTPRPPQRSKARATTSADGCGMMEAWRERFEALGS